MVSFRLFSGAVAALVGAALSASPVAAAEEWGSFSGQVSSVSYLSGSEFSLVSDLTISLNSGWSLADLEGRTEGQIANKTIAYNTADSKYYATIGYTATSTNTTDTQICFEPVPIAISLNQEVDGSKQGRIVNGYFFIGCVDKTKIEGYSSSSSAASSAVSSKASSIASSIASSSAISSKASSIASSSAAKTTSSAAESTTVTSSAVESSTVTSSAEASATITAASSSSAVETSGSLAANSTVSSTVAQANAGSTLNAVSSSFGLLVLAVAFLA